MKKKLLSFIFAICLIIPCAFIMTACGKNPDGDNPPQPIEHRVTLKTLNDLNDKLDSIEAFFGDMADVQLTQNDFVTYWVEEGENVLIRLTTNQAIKYTEEDVVLVEKNNKEFTKTIEIKQNGHTQNVIEITISNITNDCYFNLGLADDNKIHEIKSMPIGYYYDIRYTTSGSNDQVVLLGLEEIFKSISVWSDKAGRFISYNDTEADDTLKTKLELENIKVDNFKVYVRFANLITFNSKTLNNLVVLRDMSGSLEDVPLTFNPQSVTKNGVVCYEYTLDINKLHNITDNSKIILHYEKDLGIISSLPTEAELQVMMDYAEMDGHKFSKTTYKNNLTSNREIFATIIAPEANAVKKLNEAVTYKIKVGVNGSSEYVDSSKIDVYVGDKTSGIKAEYNDVDGYHYVKIPVNAYPSQYGNAEYFYLTMSPNEPNIDDVLDTEKYTLVPVTTSVEDVAMYNVTENEGELWRTTLSEDGKTQIQYFVVSKTAIEESGELQINKKFYYANYDNITVRVTFNGRVNTLYFDFKAIYNNHGTAGDINLSTNGETYNIHENNQFPIDSSYIEYRMGEGNHIEFLNVVLDNNDTYDGKGIKYEIISGMVGKTKLKGYSYYNSVQNDGTTIEVETNLTIKRGNDVVPSTNGEYELDRGVTYNFELTIQDLPDYAGSYKIICNGFRVIDLSDDFAVDIIYTETGDKIVGTICINTPFNETGYTIIDYFTIGIYY